MGSPVIHFEITGADDKKLREFYGKLFGWTIEHQEEMEYSLVASEGDKSIGGGLSKTPKGLKPYVTIYVQVADLEATLKKAEELGGKTVLPPTPIPGIGSSAWFSDPDGNNIGLFKAGA